MAWQDWKKNKFKKYEKKEKYVSICSDCLGDAKPKKMVEIFPPGERSYYLVVCTKCLKGRMKREKTKSC